MYGLIDLILLSDSAIIRINEKIIIEKRIF